MTSYIITDIEILAIKKLINERKTFQIKQVLAELQPIPDKSEEGKNQ